jgi:hypothetical protein
MYSSLPESVIIIEFHTTEAYLSLDLVQAKYSIGRAVYSGKEKCVTVNQL